MQCMKVRHTCGPSPHVSKTILGMSVKFSEVAQEVVPNFLLEHVYFQTLL